MDEKATRGPLYPCCAVEEQQANGPGWILNDSYTIDLIAWFYADHGVVYFVSWKKLRELYFTDNIVKRWQSKPAKDPVTGVHSGWVRLAPWDELERLGAVVKKVTLGAKDADS